jgi:hypothetical protein
MTLEKLKVEALPLCVYRGVYNVTLLTRSNRTPMQITEAYKKGTMSLTLLYLVGCEQIGFDFKKVTNVDPKGCFLPREHFKKLVE